MWNKGSLTEPVQVHAFVVTNVRIDKVQVKEFYVRPSSKYCLPLYYGIKEVLEDDTYHMFQAVLQ